MLVVRVAVRLAVWIAGLALRVCALVAGALASLAVRGVVWAVSGVAACLRRAAEKAAVARTNARAAKLRRTGAGSC